MREIAVCMNSARALLNAHMASLLLGKAVQTHVVAEELLKYVSTQRESSEQVASVIGILEHIREKLPPPYFKTPNTSCKIAISNQAPQ